MITAAVFAFAMQVATAMPALKKVPANVSAAAVIAASDYHIPAALLLAVAKVESHFDSRAVSRCGAVGIMQILPSTANTLGVSDPFRVFDSILGAAKYLHALDQRYGGLHQAVFAYNTGHGGTPWQVRNSPYVQVVMHEYRILRAEVTPRH